MEEGWAEGKREMLHYVVLRPGRQRFGRTAGRKQKTQVQAITDLLAGQMQVSFDIMPTMVQYAKTGKLHALAVTTATRSPTLPEIPPVADFVPAGISTV